MPVDEPQPAAPEPVPEEPQPEAAALNVEELAPAPPEFDADAALLAALDSLGRAHHRPFSR